METAQCVAIFAADFIESQNMLNWKGPIRFIEFMGFPTPELASSFLYLTAFDIFFLP